MFLLNNIRSPLSNTISRILPKFGSLYANHLSIDSKSSIPQASAKSDEEDTVYEVYDDQWEVDPPIEQVYASHEVQPIGQLPFLRMKSLFNVPELVEVLKHRNVQDIVCLNVGSSFVAPYMVIGSGLSRRHIQSTTAYVHKLLKYKLKDTNIPMPLFRGDDGSCEWIAVDMSTIFLHLFMPSTRLKYDLESLWSAGPQYDEQLMKKAKLELPNKFNWEELLSEIQQVKQS
ncbi:unnamed protein product [Trichobilharzia szidati]|nr:unnamed protein product [Trichobilharzia szidati]